MTSWLRIELLSIVMTVSGSSTELEFLYRSLNPVIIWKSAVGNCQDARTLVEEEGVTVKLVGARLGARRNVSTRIMKSTFYFFTLNSPFYTVTSRNEAGVDLVLIQPFPLCYVNHIVLMQTIIF